MTAFFQPIRQELGWSYTQISFASSLRGLEMGIYAPLLGLLVDRFGARRLLFAGVLTMGVGLITLSQTHSLLSFYGAFMLIAFGAGGCTSVVTMTAVANWFHRKVGVALGVMASGFGAGGLIVPLIVGLIELFNWRITLVLLGVGVWVLGVPLSLVVRDRPEKYGYLPDGDVSPGPSGGLATAVKEPGKLSLAQAFKNPSFVVVNLAEALRLLCVTAVVLHVMPYLEDAGYSRALAGSVAASIPLVSIVGRFGFGWLSDRFNKRYVMALTFVMMGLGMLFFCYASQAALLIPFLLFFSPGFGGSMVLRGAILRDYFGRASFGKLVGMVLGSGSVGGIVGPTLAGWAFDTLGSYRPVWFALCCLALAASVLVLWVKPLPAATASATAA